MYFRDETTIEVRSGRGGHGLISFHREKYKPKGGPDGGDGGNGGSVVFVADENLNTLYELHRKRRVIAENGHDGKSNKRSGRKGRDVIVRVPVGTIVRDAEAGVIIKDFTWHDERCVVAKGGHGGRGNQHFATAEQQTPRVAEDGDPGEERRLDLELRLIADVGLVGFPNAGKSTFLSRVSAATPKIANYPFTTLVPQLGIASLDLTRTLVVADLPGLIEGAHEGAGLGHEFLRHVERTRLILHVVDCSDADAGELVRRIIAIDGELKGFSRTLADKPQVLVGNKLDAGAGAQAALEEARALLATDPDAPDFFAVHGISGATGEGIAPLLETAWERVIALKQAEAARRGDDDRERERIDVGTDSPVPDEHGIVRERVRMRGLLKTPPHERFPDEVFRNDEFDTDADRRPTDDTDRTA